MTEEERTAVIVAKITKKVEEALNKVAARQAAEIEEIEALKTKALEALRAIGALNAKAPETLRAKVEALNEAADAALDFAHEAELELPAMLNPRGRRF